MSGGANRNESRHTALKSTVSEYAQKSTIHGVAYVGDDERNKFERIWWFVMLVCSIFGACYLIYQAYRTMKENPIIESPSLAWSPMWEVLFPAVTFCPNFEGKLTSFALNQTNWPEFTHNSLEDNLTELANNYDKLFADIIVANSFLQRTDQSNYDIVRQFMPEIVMNFSRMGSFPANFSNFWQNTIPIGACVTFNMFNEKDILRDGVVPSSLDNPTHETERLWSRDSGYKNNLGLQDYTYPFRSFELADSLLAAFNVNDSQRFYRFNMDILVIFHAPDEAPLFDRHSEYVRITPGKYNIVEITPHLVVSEGIEHYDPEVRQCYYSNERHLKFYKNYTQNHCESECIVNYTLAECGCVVYDRPHFNDTKLCTTKSEFDCFFSRADTLFLPSFLDDDEGNRIVSCNCLPSCNQISYKPVHTSTIADDSDNSSWVSIHNKYPQLRKHVRTELHSISEFFSNCGGSLGLFLGVSIFSIVELLYFCTIRLYLQCKKSSSTSNE